MRYPAFVEELRGEPFRGRLLTGVATGYLITLVFALLAAGAVFLDLSPYGPEFLVLLAVKLATNTAAWLALARRWRGGFEVMSLNTLADVVCMTAAMYFTGGPASPLFAVYVIEVAVVALLSNLGATLLVAGAILASFGTMCTLLATGALPPTDAPIPADLGARHVIIIVGYAGFAIGVPTLFTAMMLRRLRDREAALAARTDELIEAGKQKSIFLASVTHELRTPIHGITGLADLVATGVYGPTTDKQRDAAASIKRSAQSLLHLIDDLLALVKAEVGRLEVTRAPFPVRDLVEQVTASVQWMLGTKQLALRHEVDDATATTDRRLVGHILVNLVANAAKFTPEGGDVVVRARVRDGRLVVEVADTGAGIPDDRRAEIFEAFRQLDGSDERAFGGVGLGLALVKRCTELLGGTVAVDSAVGRGSTFTVEVPA